MTRTHARKDQPPEGSTSDVAAAPGPWQAFADALLQQEALMFRVNAGVAPQDFAGLYITDEEIDRIMGDLPGLAEPKTEAAASIRERCEPLVDAARTALHDSLATPTSLFAATVWNVGASPEEAEVLALIAAVELDPGRQRLIAYVQDNVTQTRPTLSTLRRMFPPPHLGPLAVSVDAPISRGCLVHVDAEGPWATRAAELHTAFAWALAGDTSLDPELPVGARPWVPDGAPADGAALLVVSGGDRTTRRMVAFERTAGTAFLVTPTPEAAEQWEAVVREATVAGLAVILELGDAHELDREARRWIERTGHLNWAMCSDLELTVESLPDRPWVEAQVEDGHASPEEWAAALGRKKEGGHQLNREQLRLAARAFAGSGDNIDAAVRRLASGHLDRLATRIRPRRDWDDLVLPADQVDQLHELAARYRHRDTVYQEWGFRAIPSMGLVALFSGQSGTGKTLTAEIIAGELGLDLYKVDLSAVVSKYIGETEKNLESIFSAAAAGNLVLFFDEADSLFGKRSEVSDAHDRYANIEVSYLLQRLERYDGLVILATNFQKNIDQAFLRRIHVSVDFPMPEEDERRHIWELSFPKTAPAEGLDLGFLARQFKISGGSIRNSALNAAFLAAEADEPISMESVMLGLKREFQKLGRLRTATEFEGYFDLVNGARDAAPA